MSEPEAVACWRCGTPGRPGAKFCRSCGAELAGGASQAAPEPGERYDPDSKPQRRALRRRLVVIGIIAAVLAAGYAGVDWIQRTWFGPEELVERLFEAIDKRDSAAIRDMGCGEDAHPLCAVGALKKGYTPATGWRITGTQFGTALRDDHTRRPLKAHAKVGISYELNGRRYRDYVAVRRDWQGFFRTWYISQLPGHRLWIISPHLEDARLAAAKVKTVPERPGSIFRVEKSVWALPGTYTLRAAPHHLYDDPEQEVFVDGQQDEVLVPLVTRVKRAADKEIKKQIRQRLDECAEATDLDPSPVMDPRDEEPLCPFEGEDRTVVRDVRWNIDSYPTVRLVLDESGPVWVTTDKAGKATVTYRTTDDLVEPKKWRTEAQTVEFEVGDQVEVVGGKVRWVRQR